MANIVELREMSDEALDELIENAREEMFNLRFQHASARLADVSRIRAVRRELAQLLTVANMRKLAVETAANQPDVAQSLTDKNWSATSHFNYEESAWQVEFVDEDDNVLATTLVNLNKKQVGSRRARKQL
jgi:large subunit ribosomal protein L29